MYGGQDITDGTTFRCTANISANDGRGNWYVMTSGHCALPKGTRASQNNSDSRTENANSGLYAYTAAKSVGTSGDDPTYNGATTTCDCEAFGPIPAGQATKIVVLNSESLFQFNYVANNQNRYTGRPRACEDGVSEYNKYNQIICGPVDYPVVNTTEETGSGLRYKVNDAFHVAYDGGLNPLGGDSGAPTGNGDTLLGLVTDGGGNSSKTLHISSVCTCANWIVPGH